MATKAPIRPPTVIREITHQLSYHSSSIVGSDSVSVSSTPNVWRISVKNERGSPIWCGFDKVISVFVGGIFKFRVQLRAAKGLGIP